MEVNKQQLSKIKELKKPAIIAISGFGGSGKSTLANMLANILNVPVVSIDSFNKGLETYSNWELMDFNRLEKEVLEPFYAGDNPIKYIHFSGESRENPKEIEVENKGLIIVEGVGLLRPELMKHFSYSIWVKCPLDEATKRGKKRDFEFWHNPKDELWEGIWKRNDLEYYEKYKPEELVDLIIDNS